MTLRVAVQMDPLDKINPAVDSTVAIALEAQKRGHTLWHYSPDELRFDQGVLKARAHGFAIKDSQPRDCSLGQSEDLTLSEVDVVWIRQDPPFDMAYFTNAYLLEHLPSSTLVVNNPEGIRNSPEKLLPLRFPELIPPTLITNDRDEIAGFLKSHKDIVVKPIYEFGGRSIFRLSEGDSNFDSIVEFLGRVHRLPIIAQPFLVQVYEGDKRILLVDGKAVGGFNRIPKKGDFRSNMIIGGTPVAASLNARDIEICEALGPVLKELGLLFVGIDVIGDYLTEINVTSPTGINVLNKFNSICVESLVWDAIEEKVTQ